VGPSGFGPYLLGVGLPLEPVRIAELQKAVLEDQQFLDECCPLSVVAVRLGEPGVPLVEEGRVDGVHVDEGPVAPHRDFVVQRIIHLEDLHRVHSVDALLLFEVRVSEQLKVSEASSTPRIKAIPEARVTPNLEQIDRVELQVIR